MKEVTYHFKIQVKNLDGRITYEYHTISELDSQLGSAMATGKVVRFYDSLKEQKKIKEYRLVL